MFAQNYAPEPSGNAPYVTGLAEGLASDPEFEVSVVTAHPYYPEWRIRDGYGQWSRTEVCNEVRLERKLHYVPRRPSSARRLLSEVTFGLRSVFARWHKPDVIVLVSPSLFACAVTLLRARFLHRGVPVVTWVQDLYSLGIVEAAGARGPAAGVVGAVERKVLLSSTRTVVIHDRFRRHVVDELGLPAERAAVVRNWTHIDPPSDDGRSDTRTALGWSADEIVALHTGNMGLKQGLENVIEAARLSDQRGLRVRFVLLGGGNQLERLKQLALGVHCVEFMDSLPDWQYAATLAAADVLLVNELPGVSGMSVPSKLTSYFASKRPVVAATADGSVTEEEVLSSGAGVRVPANRPEALLNEVVRVAGDSSLAAELGEAGMSYYRRHLSADAAMSTFKEILRSVQR